MERRGFLKKMGCYAAGAFYALLPMRGISSSKQSDIIEIAPEKITPFQLAAAGSCNCPCKKDYTQADVRVHALAKPSPTTTVKTTPKPTTTVKPTPPKQCQCGCTPYGAGPASMRSSVGMMQGHE